MINLVRHPPAHADFSEDTYRVLSAVDSAVMLVDAARGLEPQTLKLFQVCARRGIPVITVINKWDRVGLDALALLDEIEQRIGLRPTPLTWPVGEAGDFHGVLDRRTGEFVQYSRSAGGATRAPEVHHDPDAAAALVGGAVGGGRRGPRAARRRRRRPRPGAVPGREDHPGALRLRAAQLRRRAAARTCCWPSRPAPARRPRPTGASARSTTTSAPSSSRSSPASTPTTATGSPYARVCSGVFERGG